MQAPYSTEGLLQVMVREVLGHGFVISAYVDGEWKCRREHQEKKVLDATLSAQVCAQWRVCYADGAILGHVAFLTNDNWKVTFSMAPYIIEARDYLEHWKAFEDDSEVIDPPEMPEEPRPMDTAPKDHTIVRLLVRFTKNPLDDVGPEDPVWTIGHNGLADTGEDRWDIAGWNWEQDCYDAGEGEPIGWLPLAP